MREMMHMKKRNLLVGAAAVGTGVLVALSGGVGGVGALSASAHTPEASLTCESASVSLTSYDRHATADVTLDGVSVHTGEFGGRLVETYPIAAGPDSHTLIVHVVSRDGSRYGYDRTITVDECAPVAPPTEEPTAPPTTPPADVVVPQVQDYITCKGGAFVLDNTGSTVPVPYTINDLPFTVEAGQALHTDADGTLIQPNSDFAGYTIKAGDRTWNFPSAGNCPTVPPTTPPSSEPSGPTPTPSTPELPQPSSTPTPPVTAQPNPSDQPTAPAPSTTPSPSTPQPGTTSPSAPASTSTPTPAAEPSNSGMPQQRDTDATLAYTGSPLAMGAQVALVGFAVLAVGFGCVLLIVRNIRRNKGQDQ